MPSAPRLHNRVAIVTGASQGFGREICRQFALEGALVVCADLRAAGEGLDKEDGGGSGLPTHEMIQKELGGKAIFVQTDVTKAADVEGVVQRAVAEYGRLDILVNNAGICPEAVSPAAIDESDESMFDSHMAINTKGAFLGCKYAVRQMKKQEKHESGLRGWIVNIASVAAIIGMPGMFNYTMSKGAIVSLTRAVAAEVGQFGIVCNAICPGSSYTKLLDDALKGAFSSLGHDAIANMYPLKRFGRPVDQAKSALYLSSDDAAWTTGAILSVDGGLSCQ